uniref:Bm7616, isoform b n=1 Tax=Brugia malayi TaxID=6279 RepID=A0A1I9G0K4_BRUMA|nr:Bm7616, isoform b [Brugia malayi]
MVMANGINVAGDMVSTMEYEWGIIIFGDKNKGEITYEMMRSFANVFRESSSKLGLNLARSPSFLFTKNVVMAQREVDEWCDELESDEDKMLVILFNDSDSNEVEEKIQKIWSEKILLYIQTSESLLLCARNKTEEMIGCWVKEICELLSEKFCRTSEVEFGSEDTKEAESIKTNVIETTEKLSNEELFIRRGENQEEHVVNRDCPLLDFVHVENIFENLQKLEKPLKDLDLIKYIDGPLLHNRLRIPFTDREQNVQLLAILSAASFTELPDLQSSVVNLLEAIINSDFISFMLRGNVCHMRSVTSAECYRTLFIHLQDVMQILYISRVKHIQDFDIACEEFLYFMELIPEKCWSAIDEKLKLTVFKMLQKLVIDPAVPLAVDSHEDWESNMADSDMKCFEEKRKRTKHYLLACINDDVVEPPEDFRTLPVYATSSDILHPVQPYIRKNIVKGSYSSQEHYLDIQFRLMREDLIGPLRDGIELWRQQKEKEAFVSYATDANEELDLLIIKGVIVEGAQLKQSTGEIIRYIIFQPPSADNSWDSRLKFGQLVTLSSDRFQEEALLATIAEKDSDDFSEGKLGLHFFDDHLVSRTKIYTLVESSSYYEMYQHVLECIKRFDNSHTIPFGRFLVNVETNVGFPSYLVQVIDEDSHSSSDSLKSEYTDYSASSSSLKKTVIAKEISIFGTKYKVDKLKYTLDGNKIACGLDDAQRNALCYALTHELALIQGPPGTGYLIYSTLQNWLVYESDDSQEIIIKKEVEELEEMCIVCMKRIKNKERNIHDFLETQESGIRRFSRCIQGKTFLGRLIIRILLENITMWNPERINPIIVVCFTNHALDQFLDGILVDLIKDKRYNNELPSIVRFGSRCKSETLQKYTKRSVLKAYSDLIPDTTKHKASKIISERIHLLKMIRSQVAILMHSKNEILSYKHMQCVMLPEHVQQFNVRRTKRRRHPMDEIFCTWLLEGDVGREDCVIVEDNANEKIVDFEEEEFFGNGNAEMSTLWFKDETLVKEQNEQKKEIVESLPQVDDCITWEEIQEQLLKSNPDISDYYHCGEWDLNKDPNASTIEDVTILSEQTHARLKHNAKYAAELIADLKNVKADILKSCPLTSEEASSIKNLQTLHRHRRWALYMHWIKKLKIIGATTTGAAKIKPFLDRLGCPIVLVEEAAEVLEAHVFTSITNKCQHAILIGDHKQLRPNPAVFALAREYNLDISLFERLIKNGFPYALLESQHRMAPAIANTLMPEFYPLMRSSENVFRYPNVEGCQKNLYFISHCHDEDVIFSTSRKNSFEGDFMVNLSAYFVQQGYACSQITLLCAYTAQANYVRTQIMLKFNNANLPLVETIDNYQGEENDIVILSLVRSQPSSNAGFLGISNRVCVALSRSKLGLYVIGNMHFLKSNSALWNRLYISLSDVDSIGDGFPAFCAKHDATQIIYNADEFLIKTPEGGCYYSCDFVRPCGHICGQPCHRTDQEHNKSCTHPCLKTCSTASRHPCTKLCGEPCGKCQFFVNKTFPCGHTTGVVCYLFEEAVCQQKCSKELPCGHQCRKKCREPCKCSYRILMNCGHTVTASCSEKQETKCIVEVEKIFATCSHRWSVPCYNYEDAQCGEKCGRILLCGHRCQSLCGKCTLEGCASCTSVCGKRLSCGHECLRTCGIPCEPCIAPCSNQCEHSHCGQELDILVEQKARCADFCSFCVQRCTNSCKHRQCQMKCWQVCSIRPCCFPCDKKLDCGHTCLSLCGEVCPDVCAQCQGINVPVLQFQGCKCIVSVKEADSHIGDQTLKKQQYTCPKCACKLLVNSCFRYAKELKEQAINNEKIKFTKLLTDDLLINLQCDVLKQAENNLARISRIAEKKNSCAIETAEILRVVITRLNTEFYNHSGIMKWQVMVNMLSDMCQLLMYIITEKFTSIPKKRYSNLYTFFRICFGITNSILPLLEMDLVSLSVLAKLLKTESPSMLEIPVANELRKVSIKYMLGRLANDFIKKMRDLDASQLNDLLKMTMKALKWSSDTEQKKASVRFVQYYRDLYKVLNVQHIPGSDLRCMNFSC